MTLLMGPVLSFRRLDAAQRQWEMSGLVIADGAPGGLTWRCGNHTGRVLPEELLRNGGRAAWRYRFAAPLGPQESTIEYDVADRSHRVGLPAADATPRMAYASCNGFSALKDMKRIADKNAMWRAMADRHASAPYHLLLLGGDQIYADSMWEIVPTLRAWGALSFAAANKARFTNRMRKEVEAFFFDLYATRWAQPEVAAMLASVPTVAMWDDHEILDGWGSYPEERQQCSVFQGIWQIARRAFVVFQQQLAPDETRSGALEGADGPLSFALLLPNLALLALDMRSQRSATEVIGRDHWDKVFRWMDDLPERCGHLLVMSSIPVIYPGFDTLEMLLGAIPGHQDLEDDLRDHWRSRPHKGERLRLVHRLLAAARTKQVRPTILSGDVHVAALGVIESARDVPPGDRAGVINQLISSAIVHPPPNAAVVFALRNLFGSHDEIDTGIAARMVEFPGTQERFIGIRNFLSIEPDVVAAGNVPRLWVNWVAEGALKEPYVKVIHPIRFA